MQFGKFGNEIDPIKFDVYMEIDKLFCAKIKSGLNIKMIKMLNWANIFSTALLFLPLSRIRPRICVDYRGMAHVQSWHSLQMRL
jgi:hypothetical protein